MTRYAVKNRFTRGEITPLAHERNDLDLYAHGAAELTNWLVRKEGGITKRPGTMFRGETKFADKYTRLIGFVYSSTQAYALEFGDEYVRFWHEDGQVVSAGSPYEIASQYTEDDIAGIQWAQTGDTMFVAFKSKTKPPKKLTRSGHASWAWSDVNFRDGPYLPINDVAASTVTPDITPATGSTSTLTFGGIQNVNDGAGFLASDVGRSIRVQFGGFWSWGRVTAVTLTTEIDVLWEEGNGGGTTPSKSWRLGAFSATTGYPGSVTLYNNRVVWGASERYPRGFGYSMSNLPEVFSPSDTDGTVADDHGGWVDILGGDEILWMHESTKLQIGMPRSVRTAGPSDAAGVFGPRNIKTDVEVNEGVHSTRPVQVGPSTVHAGRLGRSINDLLYDSQGGGLAQPELSIVADHMLTLGVVEFAFQQVPYRTLWTLVADGTLVATTIERYEKVAGFSRHSVDGDVRSICSIPWSTSDTLYLVVRRNINGVDTQYVETLAERFDSATMSKEAAHYVDVGGVYFGAATNTISGITWLKNAEVAILADGAVLPNAVVNGSGVLTLPNGATPTTVHFGRPITAVAETLPAPTEVQDGSALGRPVRVVDAYVSLFEALGVIIRSDTGLDETTVNRRPEVPMGQSPPLYTGRVHVLMDGSWGGDGKIKIISTQPLPATIRAVNLQLET